MTIKKLTYLGLALLTGFLSGCSEDVVAPNTLSGNGEKTPLSVTALLDAGSKADKTRAADKDFANGDELLAYLRHVTATKTTTNDVTTYSNIESVTADQAPKLVTFIAGDMTAYNGGDIAPVGLAAKTDVNDRTLGLTTDNTRQTTGLMAKDGENQIPIYWDDFSNSVDADHDLRTSGHYLESYYGYCYNGGTPTEDLEQGTNKENGIIKWAVQANQTAADKSAFKTSDLLWSAEQTPIEYAHVDGEGKKNHGTLVLPYTHAMSKVTINVTLLESFGDGVAFNGVTTTLHEMFTHCTCTAPTYTLSNKGTATVGATTDITMWNQKSTDASTAKGCTFEAIVVPSILSVVNNFATITGLDGNTYVIPTTEAMLQKGSEHDNKGWGDQLTETEEHINNGTAQAPPKTRTTIERGKGYEMKSGVNYVLNVSISKQQITVSALIKNWVDVNAEGVGLVQFISDVNGKGDIAEELKSGGFDVYKNSDNTAFDTKTTTLTWDNPEWTYSPVIYWAGQQDEAYFRALSPKDQDLAMSQGDDMLWGYACDDDANNGSKVGTDAEVKITPRTGDVPLHFEHPMSKISVKLETATGDYSIATNPAVNLAGATIEITNLSKTGTLELVKGAITPGEITAGTAIEGTVSAVTGTTGTSTILNLPVIPQAIGNDARIKLTLADGTTYSLQLNTCVDSNSSADPKPAITEWERGKHYTYTIHVEREKITFRAMIKDWEERTGSGNATLEWD